MAAIMMFTEKPWRCFEIIPDVVHIRFFSKAALAVRKHYVLFLLWAPICPYLLIVVPYKG